MSGWMNNGRVVSGEVAGRRGPWAARALALALCGIILVSLATVAPAASRGSAPAARAAGIVAWERKGFSLPAWSESELFNSGASLQQLADTGANSVTFIVTWYTPSVYSTDVSRTGATASDASLIWAIQRARALGLQVSLKPHLDPQDGQWRANINPTNVDLWFANYGAMINHYADLGQQYGASLLTIGAELVSMSTNPAYDGRWRALIGGVRGRFTGKLTYSANWGGEGFTEEWSRIPFWDVLDYLGLSAYFELATTTTPTVESMKMSWASWRANKIGPFQARWNKPVLFIEGGYRSGDGTARQPWNSWDNWPLDQQEQVDCWEALFEFWSGVSWFAGGEFWLFNTNANTSATDGGYEIQNKPAYNTVKAWFGGGVVPPTPAPPTATTAPPTPTAGPPTPTVAPPTPTAGPPTATSSATVCPVGQYRGEYFGNITLVGAPALVRCDATVSFDWGYGSPGGGLVGDGFSAQWTGVQSFPTAGEYRFTVRADDGVRVYVDGALLIDGWRDQGATTYTATRPMTAGQHETRLEYYENSGQASIQFNWTAATPTPTPTGTAAPSANLALGKPATADSACAAAEGPEKANDGATANNSKWCSIGASRYWQVDLGTVTTIAKVVIKHAGAGGENPAWNTRDFAIDVSQDGATWYTPATVSGNTANETTTTFTPYRDRYVRVRVITPTSTGDLAARLYEVEVYGSINAQTPRNLALSRPATADSACAAAEGPAKANDGATANNSKWCSLGATRWWQVDLGAPLTVSKFVIKHAGAGGESPSWDTRDFTIEVSLDGAAWTTVVTVTGNTADVTTHPIAATTARYVRIRIGAAAGAGGDGVVRLYEVEVYGP